MKSEYLFKRLYRPVQPTVKHSGSSVIYREATPNELISDFIYCFWELKTIEALNELFTYRVVADGCIDMFFQLDKPSENYVMGFCKKFTEFELENSFHYIGIHFFPTIFPTIFNIDAKEISNRFERLEMVVRSTSSFITENFSQDDNFEIVCQKLNAYFYALILQKKIQPDIRFLNALNIILKNFGVLNVQKDLDTGLSQRQLRRLFEFYVGDIAKTFSQVVRFQNILNAKPSTQSLRESKIFYDYGYFDQSHFIKEFKNFYGVTPSKAFGR
ncbi:MAG: DUF6597 domain-containing transcriptional factor [Cytophagales bacterium]